jgi:high-affinity Fe2+/Pb2+ permease
MIAIDRVYMTVLLYLVHCNDALVIVGWILLLLLLLLLLRRVIRALLFVVPILVTSVTRTTCLRPAIAERCGWRNCAR